ncbi:hypothetical protein ES705_18841 [subsurface metagenome]
MIHFPPGRKDLTRIPERIPVLRFTCRQPDQFRIDCPGPEIRTFPGWFQRAWRVGIPESQVKPDIRDGNRGRFLELWFCWEFKPAAFGCWPGFTALKGGCLGIDRFEISADGAAKGSAFWKSSQFNFHLPLALTFGRVRAFPQPASRPVVERSHDILRNARSR